MENEIYLFKDEKLYFHNIIDVKAINVFGIESTTKKILIHTKTNCIHIKRNFDMIIHNWLYVDCITAKTKKGKNCFAYEIIGRHSTYGHGASRLFPKYLKQIEEKKLFFLRNLRDDNINTVDRINGGIND